MATSKQVDHQMIVMAIREELMNYFKGTCVERLAGNDRVHVAREETGRMRYAYQRREAENERSRIIWLDNNPVLTMKQAPDRIIFHTKVLNGRPELRQVGHDIENFMERFLIGVQRERSNKREFVAARPSITFSDTITMSSNTILSEDILNSYIQMTNNELPF